MTQMKMYSRDELGVILAKHRAWLEGDDCVYDQCVHATDGGGGAR